MIKSMISAVGAAVIAVACASQADAAYDVFGSLTFVGGSLYASDFNNADNAYIFRVNSDLTSSKKIVSRFGEAPITGLATDGTNLFFSQDSFIFKTTTAGDYQNSLVLSNDDSIRALTFLGGSLYASNFEYRDNSLILKINNDLSKKTNVVNRYGEGPIDGITTDGTNLYFSEGNLIFKTTAGGDYINTLVLNNDYNVGALTFLGGALYASAFVLGDNSTIFKVDNELRTTTDIINRYGEGPINGITTDGKYLYFSEDNLIFKTTANGEYLNTYVYNGDSMPTMPTAPMPEPATWAMMISGFGLVGGTLRRRRMNGKGALA